MSVRSRLMVTVVMAATALPPAAPTSAGNPYALVDFNGDGHGDLAIGAPRADVNGVRDAGAVHVLYGTASGLSSTGDQRWHQGRLAAIDGRKLETGDRFGTALATGDFNGDDFTDLAIGVPNEDHDGLSDESGTVARDSGVVHVLYGSEVGLTATNALTILNPGDRDIDDIGERFGAALVAMHAERVVATPPFGPDAFIDLAIGAPGNAQERGFVHIYSMDAAGLGSRRSGFICPDGGPGDACGAVLAAGHITEHPFDGLVIGAPGTTVDGKANAGMVVLRLPVQDPDGSYRYSAANPVNADDLPALDSQASARMGAALAIEHISGSIVKELFIGIPGQDLTVADTVVPDAGLVLIVLGANGGPSNIVGQLTEANDDIADSAEPGDAFGSAIVAGGLAQGGGAVAVGAPGETIDGKAKAGGVNLYHVSDAVPDKLWHLDRPGILGNAAAGDRFGSVLHRMRLLGTAFDDLVIGMPLATVGSAADAGVVHILPGGTSGLSDLGDQRWTLQSVGVQGTAGAGDRFGTSAE